LKWKLRDEFMLNAVFGSFSSLFESLNEEELKDVWWSTVYLVPFSF
jgi:hypothetical protein